jgi:hypothetical protein
MFIAFGVQPPLYFPLQPQRRQTTEIVEKREIMESMAKVLVWRKQLKCPHQVDLCKNPANLARDALALDRHICTSCVIWRAISHTLF